MYEVTLQHPAERFIKSLRKEEQKRILDAIQQLEKHPRLGKELRGRLSGLRSLRVDTRDGSYRVIYKIEEMQLLVLVLRAGYRGNIYERKMGK